MNEQSNKIISQIENRKLAKYKSSIRQKKQISQEKDNPSNMTSLTQVMDRQNQSNRTQQQIDHRSSIPIKFKGMILQSIADKYNGKLVRIKRQLLYRWLVGDRIIRDVIDRIVVGQGNKSYSKGRFFYKARVWAKRQLSQRKRQQVQQNNRMQAISMDKQAQQAPYAQQIQQKITSKQRNSSNLSIQYNQSHLTIQNKNPSLNSQYFASLQDIFSNDNFNNDQLENTLKNDDFRENVMIDEAKKLKQVGVRLMMRWEGDRVKQLLSQGMALMKDGFQVVDMDKRRNQFKLGPQSPRQIILNLQTLVNPSPTSSLEQSVQNIPIPSTTTIISQKTFLQQSNLSSSLVSISTQNNDRYDYEIQHIQNQLIMLEQLSRKEEQLKSLYGVYEKEWSDMQSIGKEVMGFKTKSKLIIGDKVQTICRKFQLSLKRYAFNAVFKCYLESKYKAQLQQKYKHHCNTNVDNQKDTTDNQKNTNGLTSTTNHFLPSTLTKSRINIQTLHELFSKPLTSTFIRQGEESTLNKNQLQESKLQEMNTSFSDKLSITSIKIVKDTKDDLNDKKSSNELGKGRIRKQVNSKAFLSSVNTNKQVSTLTKSRVNFNIQPSQSSHSSSELSQSLSQSHQPWLANSQLHQSRTSFKKASLQPNIVYDLSQQSLSSNQSSQRTLQYHHQIKSHYWWNDPADDKENFVHKN